MNKATIITSDGNEVETEYKWIEETNTTIRFYASKKCYSAFSKFNVVMWFIDEEEQTKGSSIEEGNG